MFIVIGIMFLGVGLGFLLKKAPRLKRISKTITYTIYLLLFLLGISVGADREIVGSLATLGLQALVLAAAGSLGSALAAWGVYRWFFKKREATDEG